MRKNANHYKFHAQKCSLSSDLEGDGERQETIESLVYEAYEGMALKEMNKIAQQSLDDQVRHVYIVHRLGCVPVGQHSILIATSSPGRKECSSTTLKILNEIKRFVPIWKKCSLIEASACEDGSTAKWGVKSEAFWLSTDSRKNDSIDERSRFQESK